MNIHQLRTRVYRGPQKDPQLSVKKDANETMFVILLKGQKPDVVLPQFSYQDPLIQWRSDVSEETDARLASLVTDNWEETTGFCGEMCQFSIFFESSAGNLENIKVILAKHNANKDVKGDKTDERQKLLNIWSHSPSTSALLTKLLLQDQCRPMLDVIKVDSISWLESDDCMRKKCVQELMEQKYLRNESSLPMSFRFPTMGISHSILPPPCQAGIPDPKKRKRILVRKYDDRAHLKVAKVDVIARSIDNDVMRELVRMHKSKPKHTTGN